MSDSLTHRTIKNSVYSLIGFIGPLILSFVTLPIIILGLGSSRFGFYSLLNSVFVVFSLLDFGINYTFTKDLSENRQSPGGRELSVTFSSTTILYALLGGFAMVCLFLFQGTFRSVFKIPDGFISSFGLAFFIMGLSFLMKMLTVSLMQIPYALQRQDIITKISLANNAFLQIGSVIVLKTGHSIMSLLVIQLMSSAFMLLSLYFAWHRLAPDLKFVPVLSKRVLKTIGRQGFWVFLSNTMGNILAQLDKFVLGAVWGPTSVGYYSAAQMVPEKISSTSFSLSHIFFPIFSEAYAYKQDVENRVRAIFRRSLGIISLITAGLTVLVLLYGYQLVRFWVSKDFADHTALAVPILALTYFLLSYNIFFHAFLSGLKALKFLAISTMVVALVDVAFMFLLIPRYGINGASAAYLLSGLPVLAFLYFIERRYLLSPSLECLKFYGAMFSRIFFTSGLAFMIGWWFLRPLAGSLGLVMAIGALTFGVYLAIYWLLGFFAPEDIALFKVYLGRFLGAFKKPKAL